MKLVDQTRVHHSLFDVAHLQTLSGDCNVLFVSDTTLYMMQNFADNEVNWPTRYVVEELDGGLVRVADKNSPDYDEILEWAQTYRLEVFDMSCDVVGALNQISTQLMALAANDCGCNVGQGLDTDNPVEGGGVPPPVGDIVFQPPAVVVDRKCKAANYIHFSLRDLFSLLDDQNADKYGILGLGLAVSLVAALIAAAIAGPLASVLVSVAGLIATFTATLTGATLTLQDIVTVMDANQDDLVCLLYNSTDGGVAKQDYLDQLTAGGLAVVEVGLVGLLMTNAMMALLYFDTAESVTFWDTYVATVDCDLCPSPNPDDWVILPSGSLFGQTSAEGRMGTGTITQTGVFTLDAVERTDIAPGTWVVAIATQGFVDAQLGDGTMTSSPSGTHSGQVVRSTALPPPISADGRTADGSCVTLSFTPGSGAPPATYNNFQLIQFEHNGPFSVDFEITIPPTIC